MRTACTSVSCPIANDSALFSRMPRCRARATNASVRHGSGRRTHRCGLFGCVCTSRPAEHARRDRLPLGDLLALPLGDAAGDAVGDEAGRQLCHRRRRVHHRPQHRHGEALDRRRRREQIADANAGRDALRRAGDVEKLIFGQVARQRLHLGREKSEHIVFDDGEPMLDRDLRNLLAPLVGHEGGRRILKRRNAVERGRVAASGTPRRATRARCLRDRARRCAAANADAPRGRSSRDR